jgi:tetratricopeptide (TPR) repeat protein
MKFHPHDLLLLEAFGSLPREQRRPVLEHLEQCARCRERLRTLHRQRSGVLAKKLARLTKPPESLGDYDSVLDQAMQRFRSRQSTLERERSEAAHLFARLLEEAPEHRVHLLKNPRFRTWGLLELVLEEGTRAVQKAPANGEPLVRLGLTLANHLDEAFYGRERINDLRARAWSVLGNALRIKSEFPAAEWAFETAERHLRRGTGDPLEQAGISDLRASLWRVQGKFDEAMRLLERAFAIHTKAGERHQAGKALLNIDLVHHRAGRPLDGIPLLHRALDLLDPLHDPTHLLHAWHNLASNLTKAGRFMEAQGAFLRARPLYASYPGYPDRALIPKSLWIEGRLALGRGQFGEAQELLRKAQVGLAAHGLSSEVVQVEEEIMVARARQSRERARRRRQPAPEDLPRGSSS